MALKHVARVKTNKRKVIVAYRTIPGEPENCLVVQTENLMAEEHDTLMKLVESGAGQSEDEFANAMARAYLPDGRNMLAGFHKTGKLQKVATNIIEMTPDNKTVIMLDELNRIIAEQKGVAIEDLAMQGAPATKTTEPTTMLDDSVDTIAEVNNMPSNGVLSDEELAAQYRSQADTMFKEAKRLREQAEELVPTKKKKSVAESA
jgi:hypothetical protein